MAIVSTHSNSCGTGGLFYYSPATATDTGFFFPLFVRAFDLLMAGGMYREFQQI